MPPQLIPGGPLQARSGSVGGSRRSRIVASVKIGKNTKYGISTCAFRRILILALCGLSWPGAAAQWSGRVVGVSDGDTIKVLDDARQQHTIRLMGIDAPEKAQAFGQRSKQSLSERVSGQQVQVQGAKRDKYGRTVGKVLAQDGTDICLEQIARGLAWHYKKYADEQSAQDRLRYAEAENMARESGAGLWRDEAPVPPWVWRHSKNR